MRKVLANLWRSALARTGLALLLLPLLLLAAAAQQEPPPQGKVITIGPGGGEGLTIGPGSGEALSLQGAITAADPGDTIRIIRSTPITEQNIKIDKDLTIEGQGCTKSIVQAADTPGGMFGVRVFIVTGDVKVVFRNMTIRHGNTKDQGGGIYNAGGDITLDGVCLVQNAAGEGGGLYSSGGAVVVNSEVVSNTAELISGATAAGIYGDGPTTIRDSIIAGNRVLGAGSVGGIYNEGTLVIEDSIIENNLAPKYGGLEARGTTTITRTAFRFNNGGSGGGGLAIANGDAEIVDCDVYSNTAQLGGGVVVQDIDQVKILNTTIRDNAGTSGAGLAVLDKYLNVVNSTISGNQAQRHGGGVYVSDLGFAVLENVTVSYNTADADADGDGDGGGVFLDRIQDQVGDLRMRNTIIAENRDASPTFLRGSSPDCYRTLVSYGYNLIGTRGVGTIGGDPPCEIIGDTIGNLVGGLEAGLDPLADYSGPTLTHALETSSPAINAGNPSGCTGMGKPLLTDQRYATRADRCDMGAYEFGALEHRVYLPMIVRN